ncbi:MAG: sigma-70 family RNA polymerase sigma factor [Chitinophagaceae bacterium]|nr:sigma-70 family RNA polymerase sigma factor [Anaerolineae bacterium]
MNSDNPLPTAQTTTPNFGQALFDLRKQFNQTVEPHHSDLWRYCLHLTGSVWDAEDLLQDTLLKAFARLSTIFQPLEMKPYLFRIASNTWIDQMRRTKLQLDAMPDDLPAETSGTDSIAVKAAIERLVQVLPPRQRVACLLVDVFDFSLAEAAQFLQISPGATKSLLHHARASLQSHNHIEVAYQPKVELRETPDDDIVKRYIEAFNRHDLDTLLELLHPAATSDILGVFVEEGRETMRQGSLKAWADDKRPQWVNYGELEGQPTFFVFIRNSDGVEGLAWLIGIKIVETQIVIIQDYYFCADLVRFVAQAMGVPALPNPPFS